MLREAEILIPYFCRARGIEIASRLWKRFRRTLLAVSGRAEKSRGGTAERAGSRCGDKGCPAVLSLWMQRKAAAISPPTIPRTAIATDGVKAV